MTFLGFDFGTQNIGVAVGQSVTHTAQALDTVGARLGIPDWYAIDRLIEQWQPQALVVGLPLAGEGDETPMSEQARRFGQLLAKRYGLTVHWIDETLTTDAAREMLRSSGVSREKRERYRDQVAAQLILETFLNQQDSSA